MMVYKYTLHDPDSGKVLYEGTAEVEKRIQTVLQAPAMPESWERRRAR